MMCPALVLAGCTFLNDTPPKVIYQSSDTISVEYADDGLMRVSNRQPGDDRATLRGAV
jgi:hypothetical protein